MNILKNRKLAWARFLEQWLSDNDGQGHREYRRLLREEGLDSVISEWVDFINYQYSLDNISESQYTAWQTSYPIQIQWVIATRKHRGEPAYEINRNPKVDKDKLFNNLEGIRGRYNEEGKFEVYKPTGED